MDGGGHSRNSQPLCANAATRAALSASGPIRSDDGRCPQSNGCSKEPDAIDFSGGTAVFTASPPAVKADPAIATGCGPGRRLESDPATLCNRRDRDGTAGRDSRFGTRQNVQDVDA